MIGVSIFNDEVSHNLDEALALMDRWGQPMFDLREHIFGDTVIDDISDTERDALAEKLAKYSFTITCIGTRKLIVTPGPLSPEIKSLMGRLTDTAKRFRVPMIRVCSVAPRPSTEAERHSAEAERHEMMLASVDAMRELAGMAEHAGITLVLENKPTSITNKGREMAEFAGMVNHPALGLVWDAGNTWIGGEYDPLGDYLACKEYISVVHLKGAVGDGNGNYLHGGVMGRDDFPHQEIINRLVSDGYTGNITLDLAIGSIPKESTALSRAEIAKESLEVTRKMIEIATGK